MTQRCGLVLGGTLFFAFLLLTPLGIFNNWIPPDAHQGYYSVTTIDAGDDTGYYAFLRSVFFDGDLDFFNELRYAHSEKIMPTGYIFNNWQMGQALLFLPFFIIGHLLALSYQGLGYPVSIDGYSAPYYLSTAVASVSFLFAGLILVYKTLHSFMGKRFALLVSLCTWLASPLIYFSFIRQRMAHTAEFFLSAVLIFAWVHFRSSKDPVRYALLGALLGFLCMTRVINIAFIALFAVDLLWSFRSDLKSNISEAVKNLGVLGGAMLAGFILVMLPQIIAWYQLNGVPFPPRHMKYAGEGLTSISLIPLLGKMWGLFMDGKWGLVFSMPLAVAGLVGLFFKNNWLREVRPGLLAYLVAIFTVLVLYPEDSASYGHRHFISALPVFALGLCNFLRCISGAESQPSAVRRWGARITIVGCLSAVLLQYFMLIQYKVTLPYNHPEFTLKAIGSTVELISNRPDLLLRSTNFFNIFSFSSPQIWSYLDGLFLFVFPIFQLMGLAGVWFYIKWLEGASSFKAKVFTPKFMLAKSAVISALLVVIVLVSAPTKTQSEISSRMKYQEAVKSGETHIRNGKIGEAQADYILASEMEPQAWKPYLMIGQTWQAQGRIDEANRFFRKALDYNPGHSPTLTLLGNNLRRLNKTEEAEEMLRSAIRAWPLNLQAYDSLGQVLAMQDKREEAVQWLNYAVQINPNYGPGHINLAMTYHSLNRSEKSRYHLDRALALGMQGPGVDQIKSMILNRSK
ncbi:MAG: tetratricopeptide repeat protein [Nitrospina sp.]|jgi:tetratricopeptide (TPR) repeat protein|nr:tetratricopeptide repeat protein [Nitrospina sp.]